MKNLLLFPLVTASLLAQTPPAVTKIPRSPSIGTEKSTEALPVKDGVPTDTSLVQPAEPMPRPNTAVEREALIAATSLLAREADDASFLAFDTAPDGTLWAVANRYKAAFHADRWQFLGRPDAQAPSLQPLVMSLQDVALGGRSLPQQAPQRELGERQVRYDHGICVEQLDIAARGVEQTFTFAELPHRGELALTVAVRTALAGGSDADGILFTGPYDRVHVSNAIAIDARGARIAAPTSYADGRLSIRVPAEFVAAAVLPLRIDPLYSSIVVSTSTNDVGDPDIAWDETSQTWAVCWMRYFGGSDWDVYVQRLFHGSPLTLAGGITVIDGSSVSWNRPRIANLRVYASHMVVCQTSDGTTPWKVQGRVMGNSGVLVTNQFVVSSSSVDELHPDIAGDSEAPPCYFTVVWEHSYSGTDHDIYGRQVDASGVLRGSSPIFVQANGANQSWPAISNSCGSGAIGSQRFAVVYQQAFSASDNDVYGALLSWDGVQQVVAGGLTFPIETGFYNAIFPAVSSPTFEDNGQRRFLAVWERTNYEAGNIAGAVFDLGGNVLASADITDLEPQLARRAWPQYRPRADSDGYRFVVAYHEVFNGNTTTNDLDTRATMVGYGAGTLFAEEAGAALGFSGNREFNVALNSRYSGAGIFSSTMCTANDRDGISGGGFAIDAYAYTAAPQGVAVQRATACGTLGITWTGNPVAGGAITVAVPVSPYLRGLVLGTPTNVQLPFCPACTLGVDGFLWGSDTFTLFVPLTPSVVGFTFSAQGFELQPSGQPCLGQFQLSDTIDLTIG